MRRRLRLIALLLAVSLVLAACGGGDDEGEEGAQNSAAPATADLSRAEAIEQGDAICAEVSAALAGVDSAATEISAELGQTADLYAGMVEQLKGLRSAEDDPELGEVFAAGDALAQAAADAQLAADRGEDPSAAQADLDEAKEDFEAAASAYGFDECGEGASAVSPEVPTTVPAGPATAPFAPAAPAAPVTPTAPVTPAPEPAPTAPVTPEPAPAPAPAPAPEPAPPTGGAGSGGGGGGTGGTGGAGTGGIAPGG
jgi:peptidoglycan DL-endopeptidase CwlO